MHRLGRKELRQRLAIGGVLRRIEGQGQQDRRRLGLGNVQVPVGEILRRLQGLEDVVMARQHPVPAVLAGIEDVRRLAQQFGIAVDRVRLEPRVVEDVEIEDARRRHVIRRGAGRILGEHGLSLHLGSAPDLRIDSRAMRA